MFDWQSKPKNCQKNQQYKEKEKILHTAQIMQIPALSCGLLVLAK